MARNDAYLSGGDELPWWRRFLGRPPARRLFGWLSGGAVLIAAASAASLWLEGHSSHPLRLARELERSHVAIERLSAANEALRTEIEAVRSDPRMQAKAARDLLGVVGADEIVLFLETPEAGD